MKENAFSVGQDAIDGTPSKCSAPWSSSGQGKMKMSIFGRIDDLH